MRARPADLCALLAVPLLFLGCASGKPGEASGPHGGCQAGTLPAGHWVGEWQSYALSRPDMVRSGNLDLVVAAGGNLTGSTAEADNPDTGTVTGTVKASGEFSADSVVSRGASESKYKLVGNVTCEGAALVGAGITTWGGSDKGNLKFRLERAE
ncbi:MAG: hypothetical protein IPI67_23325 [Myxococcales bacterium]|nr:hypothetical protein [Myxococcales bacterium]